MDLNINRFLLYAFIISCLLFNAFIIGPVSIRIYMAIFMLFYLLLSGYKFVAVKEVKMYALFIVFYIIALLANGEFGEVNFFKYFFGRYFICFVAFYAFISLIKTRKALNNVIWFLLGLGLVNAIFSILQSLNVSFAVALPALLTTVQQDLSDPDVREALLRGPLLEQGVPGLFRNIVDNGYLSGVFAVLGLFLLELKKQNILRKFLYYTIILLLFYALFLVQQRFVFLLVCLFYSLYFYKKTKLFFPVLLIMGAVIGYIVIASSDFSQGDLGRLSNLEDKGRMMIYGLAIDFIINNILFGGQLAFGEYSTRETGVFASHNFFFNAFIYSGIFGAVIVIGLYFKMLIKSVKKLLENNRDVAYFIGGAMAVYLLNSLTHNASLITGEEMIWMLLALFYKATVIKY